MGFASSAMWYLWPAATFVSNRSRYLSRLMLTNADKDMRDVIRVNRHEISGHNREVVVVDAKQISCIHGRVNDPK